ncbi:hypothetical protein DTO164E3_7734 [Paecilomyces variotii]|nr:hypothetical protein DTO164E3_7734 [Paecilomyces variotii]KAJ9194157.1 hypothetical protein DTO032I3_7478 [Paecilomyces variotii]KAJ9280157.1 hypothetical protein DTO021D3_3074 [Paecilomyces variotii]KAJ9323756.1 hypothetical protein DTO027B3_5105 [Paecilomyces variotii]KAJ9332328.1 hypothetical protein DTO027B5_5978 [Paecilomyces variotii]
MGSQPGSAQLPPDPQQVDAGRCHGQCEALDAGSYTAQQLRHASAEHLHKTTRRFFIGPIPEGWLNSHRKSWYRMGLSFKNYSSRRATFSADLSSGEQRLGSLQDEASLAAIQQRSFPILDVIESEETGPDETQDASRVPTQDLQQLATGAGITDTSTPMNNISQSEECVITSSNDEPTESSGPAHVSSPAQSAPDSDVSAEDARNGENANINSTGRHGNLDATARLLPHNGSDNKLKSNGRPSARQRLSPVPSVSDANSSTSLLGHHERPRPTTNNSEEPPRSLQQQMPQVDETCEDPRADQWLLSPISNRLARFNLDDNVLNKQQRIRQRVQGIASKRPRRWKPLEGEVIKAEKMLVRVEQAYHRSLPDDYTENDGQKIDTHLVDKWREYLVVCRYTPQQKHAPYTLQMYKTRVVPKVQTSKINKPARHEVPLTLKQTRANLYSSLDKTLVIYQPCKHGTKLYMIRARSGANSVEWFAFIRQTLGWRRPSKLLINVPDLDVSLIIKDPFGAHDKRYGSENKAEDQGEPAMGTEEDIAGIITHACLELLQSRTEWSDVLKSWSEVEKMGLAWKRYDRLEWVVGPNERRMFGAMGMQMYHDLELRPKHHYPTAVKGRNEEKDHEPPPVEGFLIRLTSQKGVHQRFNRMFFKRLYFSTQDNYLFFCKPAKAAPPPPPKLPALRDGNIPSSSEIVQKMPIQFDIDPYPIENGDIAWLSGGNKDYVRDHDQEAYAHVRRNLHNLSQADGFINLCRVREVRYVQRGSSPADANVGEGPDIEFHQEVRDTRRDDGATNQFDSDRTFELLLNNGLVVRLQAYDNHTRDEWMKRLDALVRYWKARTAADTAEIKALRRQNLELLGIDEEMESMLGQFAQKWEVRRAQASPHLYNLCALIGCRAIKMSGPLYRKPRRHSTFTRCNVILSDGKLMIFKSTLRRSTGVEIPHIHQELDTTLDLSDCYIYAGLLTESDLLYANQTFDNNRPGRHPLPRIYLSTDGFTTCDEDTAVCFVIWHPLRKDLFRTSEVQQGGHARRRLRQVSMLGVPGRSIVFKARSRVERDRWVLSIESEMDRLQDERLEDVRIVSDS